MKAGIINITGYAGSELARILHRHPEVKITSVTGRSAAGQKVKDVFPHLSSLDLTITPELEGSLDIVFSALPQVASAEASIPVLKQGIKLIDISADFRLKNADEYEEWYGVPHPDPSYLEEAVYGLPELRSKEIKSARLIANPGCYPTSAILGLAPAVSQGIIEPDIIIDSKSGISGAGRSLSMTTHFSEVNENTMAYGLGGHRHLPEITQELNFLSDEKTSITFVPHLVPMTRGILSACYGKLRPSGSWNGPDAGQRIRDLYEDFYAKSAFVDITAQPPQTKQTLGNNKCLIYPTVDTRTGRLVVISCIDNLVKGAAGQAVQNMNLMCQFPEDTALDALAVYP